MQCKWDWEPTVKYPLGVMVGCIAKQEDLIPWWVTNYEKYNNYPVAFADFGISAKMREFCAKHGQVIDCSTIPATGWFRKPFAILKAPFGKILWTDLDIELRRSVAPLWGFSDAGKIGVGHDSWNPVGFRTHMHKDAKIWDTGVISVTHGSSIVVAWVATTLAACDIYQGDNEILSILLWQQQELINPIPKTLHFMRGDSLHYPKPDHSALISWHWTGPTGKAYIRELMRAPQLHVEDI